MWRWAVLALLLGFLVTAGVLAARTVAKERHKAYLHSLTGVFFILMPDGSSEKMNAESLYVRPDGYYRISYPFEPTGDSYGVFVEGNWKLVNGNIRLTPTTVDRLDRVQTNLKINSGDIPSSFAHRVSIEFHEQTLTPEFWGGEHPRYRIESPVVERMVMPQLRGNPVYFVPMGKR
jgi:hypothetical protein